MGGGNNCGNRVGRIIYRRVYEREGYLPQLPCAHDAGRGSKHAEYRDVVIWPIHVRLRDRLAVAAGGDHWSGGDGEEEDLKAATSGELRGHDPKAQSSKLKARSSWL